MRILQGMRVALKTALLIVVSCVHELHAQPWFNRYDSIAVDIFGSNIKNPWAGGLNFCQLSDIDLDLDGKKDLFVFDRTGDKVSTFMNGGTPSQTDYKHAPKYSSRFPQMEHWALLLDYNGDGKEDIFTYARNGISGITVYKNISDATNGLAFSLATPLIKCDYGSGKLLNLYVSSVDIPAITDMDNDGDVDVVTFGILGTYVEYHRNYSKELYGHADSLVFKMSTSCWGKFAENFSNNSVSMGISCKGFVPEKFDETGGANKHAGSCELCFDQDGDGDKEVILGDVAYSNLTMLVNGGDSLNALMVSQDSTFPKYDTPLNMQIFPCAFYLDVDNDGRKDLIASPSGENVSHNFTSISRYKNTGSGKTQLFSYQQNDFLQDNMIDLGEGSYPVLFDHNSDGLLDLIVGNAGYYDNYVKTAKLALFENVGSAQSPKFKLITRDYAGLSSLAAAFLAPAFGDIDGDGDADMLLGNQDGRLNYYVNTAGPGNIANFAVAQPFLKNHHDTVIDVGNFAAPFIIDLDRDGKQDLVIGERSGNLNFYKNTGSPAFAFVTDSLGGVNVMPWNSISGYSQPAFFELNNKYCLLVGSETGGLHYFNNIENNLSGKFNRIDTLYLGINDGIRSAPFLSDLDNDGLADMVLGNYAGGLTYYRGSSTISLPEITNATDILIFPNPAHNIVNISLKKQGQHISAGILDLAGREILQTGDFYGNATINTASLEQGIYLLIVKNSNENIIAVNKLVISH